MPSTVRLVALSALVAACAPTEGEVVYADPAAGMVVGGYDADIADHPALLSLQLGGQHLCGATLIDPFWAVTAAHCLDVAYVGGLQVETGGTVLGDGTTHDVVAWIEHPDHVTGQKPNDIALLRLGHPIEGVDPLPLLTRAGEAAWAHPGTLATVAGWGALDAQGTDADTLQAVEVPLIDLGTCQSLYDPDREVLDTMVCAGDTVNGGIDACQGDSGGPLAVPTDAGWALYGVVSWGMGCAEAEHPGVYTRVPSFVNWIQHEAFGAELDDVGDDVGNAEPVGLDGSLSWSGSFLPDDIDTFALSTSERHEITVVTTSALDITARVVASDGTLLAASSGVGDVFLVVELDGEATVFLEGPEGEYTLDITSVSLVPASSGGSGCSGSSSLWTTVVGPLAFRRRRWRAARVALSRVAGVAGLA